MKIEWSNRDTIPVEGLVMVILTREPEQWVEAVAAWGPDCIEWVMCSETYGIGAGAGAVIKSCLDNHDLPCLLFDDSGADAIADQDTTPDLILGRSTIPVIHVVAGSGYGEGDLHRRVVRHDALVRLGWEDIYDSTIDPDPGRLVSLLAGWWMGRKNVTHPRAFASEGEE